MITWLGQNHFAQCSELAGLSQLSSRPPPDVDTAEETRTVRNSTQSINTRYSPDRPSQPQRTPRRSHCLSSPVPHCRTDFLKFSFFRRTTVDWNSLLTETTKAKTLAPFSPGYLKPLSPFISGFVSSAFFPMILTQTTTKYQVVTTKMALRSYHQDGDQLVEITPTQCVRVFTVLKLDTLQKKKKKHPSLCLSACCSASSSNDFSSYFCGGKLCRHDIVIASS